MPQDSCSVVSTDVPVLLAGVICTLRCQFVHLKAISSVASAIMLHWEESSAGRRESSGESSIKTGTSCLWPGPVCTDVFKRPKAAHCSVLTSSLLQHGEKLIVSLSICYFTSCAGWENTWRQEQLHIYFYFASALWAESSTQCCSSDPGRLHGCWPFPNTVARGYKTEEIFAAKLLGAMRFFFCPFL